MRKYDEYEKNRNIKPDTVMSNITSVAKLGLLLLGIIGLSVEFFRDDGWLHHAIDKLLNSSVGLASIPIIIILLIFVNKWMTSATDGKASTRGNLPMYLMMTIGLFFLFNLITKGSF